MTDSNWCLNTKTAPLRFDHSNRKQRSIIQSQCIASKPNRQRLKFFHSLIDTNNNVLWVNGPNIRNAYYWTSSVGGLTKRKEIILNWKIKKLLKQKKILLNNKNNQKKIRIRKQKILQKKFVLDFHNIMFVDLKYHLSFFGIINFFTKLVRRWISPKSYCEIWFLYSTNNSK